MDDTDLPDLDVDQAKRVLAGAIGRRLEAIAEAVQGAIEDLDALRRTVGFVNGLGGTAAACKRELEETARKIREEVADVRRALNEKPEPVASVDHQQAEAVRTEKQRRVS